MQPWSDAKEITDVVEMLPKVYYSGKVTKVIGLTVEAYIPHVPIGALCQIHLSDRDHPVAAEVIGLRGRIAILMPIGSTTGIQVGDEIEPIRNEVTVWVSPDLLGRVIDGMGAPIDGKGAIETKTEYPLYHSTISPVRRKMIHQSIGLGVRAIDGLLTTAIGQRIAIMAGSGVGKSTLLGMMARNTEAQVNVIGLIGERGREVREFIENSLGPEGMARSVIIVATSDAPALERMRAAFVATTVAEYFRDRGSQVLLMIDSLTRYAMASREVGLSLGEPPTVKGYTPSLFSNLPRLLERAGTTEAEGSITGIYTILTEGDDIQDPVADAVRAIVDGHIILDRKMAMAGHYPPIDILNSISRVMSQVVDKEHHDNMIHLRSLLSLYEEMKDYIKIGLYTEGKNLELDQAVQKHEDIENFLKQDAYEITAFEETKAWMANICQ